MCCAFPFDALPVKSVFLFIYLSIVRSTSRLVTSISPCDFSWIYTTVAGEYLTLFRCGEWVESSRILINPGNLNPGLKMELNFLFCYISNSCPQTMYTPILSLNNAFAFKGFGVKSLSCQYFLVYYNMLLIKLIYLRQL